MIRLRLRLRLGLRLGLGFIFYIYFVSTKPTALSCITNCYVTGGVLISFLLSRSTGVSITTAFLKRIGFWARWLPILRILHNTNMLYKRLRVFEWIDKKWLGINFLLLKNHINSKFRYVQLQFLLEKNSVKLSCAYNGRCVALWNFSCLWFADPTFLIK